jgi:uncharacterized membrane protein YdjX (TVP38/TMEM64 family)
MMPNNVRILAIAVAFLCMIVFFSFHDYLTLEKLKVQHQTIKSYQNAQPFITSFLYGLLYVVITGFSLPGAAILTLAGGALFGLFWGTVIVSLASTIGAVLAFWAARFFFREPLEQRFANLLATVNTGIEKEGGYYLFTLRLIPLVPFFAINLVMGLTHIKTSTFFWISQLGMLPGTLLYVNAGTQLTNIKTLADIASPAVLFSFVLLGIFPLLAKKLLERRHDHPSS